MARKSQVDVAIERLQAKKLTALALCEAECAALDAAIEALKGPIVRRVRKPKVVDRPAAVGE